MQEREIKVTWEAIYDITDITDYIERDFGIARADKFQADIKEQIIALGNVGGIFGNTKIDYRGYHIFKKPFPPSIVFYILKEPEKEIHILRILREERDWEKIMKEDRTYTYPQ